jgi:hypothetical protein
MKPGKLAIKHKPEGPYLHLRWGRRGERYIGPLYVSVTPLLDCILANLDRLSVDEMARLIQIDKSWRPINA